MVFHLGVWGYRYEGVYYSFYKQCDEEELPQFIADKISQGSPTYDDWLKQKRKECEKLKQLRKDALLVSLEPLECAVSPENLENHAFPGFERLYSMPSPTSPRLDFKVLISVFIDLDHQSLVVEKSGGSWSFPLNTLPRELGKLQPTMRSEEPPVGDEDEGTVASWGVLVSRMFEVLRIVSQVYNLVIAQACNAGCEKGFLFRQVGYMVLSIASCDRKNFNLVDAEQLKLPYTAVDRMDKLTRIAYGILEGGGNQQPRELVPTLLSGYHDGRKSPGSAPSTTSYWMGSVFVYLTATKLSKLPEPEVENIVKEAVAKGREVKPEFRMIVFSIWDFILVEVTPETVAPSQCQTLWTSRPASPADDNGEPKFRMFLFEPHRNFAKLACFFLHKDRSDDLTGFGISRKLRVVNQDNGALSSLPLPGKEDIEREGLLTEWNLEEGQSDSWNRGLGKSKRRKINPVQHIPIILPINKERPPSMLSVLVPWGMTSRRAPPSTMRTRNTIRVSPTSESSRPGASGQDHTPSSMYDSTTVVSEKNTLFLPQELKLGGPSNWEQYSPAQKAILRINGLEDAVFSDYPPEEQQTMDQKTRAAKAAVSIREMYNLLQAYCIGTGPVLLQTTLYQFIRIKTSSYETIPQFNVDFERLVKLLLEQKEPISDTLKKVVYLTACENEYPDWTARQRALLRSEHPPTLRSMQQDLIDENRSSDDDDSHGTASTYWAHSKKTGRKGPTARKQEASGRRRGSSKNRRATNKSSQETNHRIGKHKDHTCTNCKKRGHHENDCWFAHKDKRPDWAVRLAKELMEHDLQRDNTKNLHIKESNHMTVERSFLILEDSVSDELPMDNTEACKVSLDNISSPTAWLFDTGSSVHICNDQSLFTELQPATRTVLVTGGGKVYPSGRGTVKICFINKWGDQVPVNLKDTLFIPEFPVNVMSGLRLYKNGGWIDGNDIYDPTGDVFGLLRIGRDGLYVNTEVGKTAVSNQAVSELQPEPCNHHIVSSKQCLDVDLWHRRLGHVNIHQVSQTAKITRGMFCDSHHNHEPFNYCLACDIAKALRWTPRNKRKRALRAGFIHVDTFKVNPPGIRGERWGMIATDDRHRMRWAYTFTRKGMASELLGQLISKIRTQYGIRVYAIQMDGGSELYGASLKNLEYTHGVKIIKTTPYTPEFNGVAERSNRIIFDKVRATMESERIPIELWPLVLEDMVRKTNVTATRAIDGLTPMESFLNEALPAQDNKPDLSGERICGSQVTIHIPQERRLRSHKFGPRGEAGIYLCMEGSQIYTCWVPSRRKGHQIVRSANVQFYEKVRETELLTETEHDVEPEIRKNGAPISSRPQSVTEQTKTPSPQSMDRRQHP
ncbi:hypothetical protein FOFC_02499 [Fusarium oxysporum]|nr:hypothetical protein FOFC_02499 [Fusarium oxysporum]